MESIRGSHNINSITNIDNFVQFPWRYQSMGEDLLYLRLWPKLSPEKIKIVWHIFLEPPNYCCCCWCRVKKVPGFRCIYRTRVMTLSVLCLGSTNATGVRTSEEKLHFTPNCCFRPEVQTVHPQGHCHCWSTKLDGHFLREVSAVYTWITPEAAHANEENG